LQQTKSLEKEFQSVDSIWPLFSYGWLSVGSGGPPVVTGHHIGNGPLSGSQGHRQEVEMDGEERRAVMQNSWEL
jgi:hypothetical protein